MFNKYFPKILALCDNAGKCSRDRQATDKSLSKRSIDGSSVQEYRHTLNVLNTLLFYGNNSYVNALKYYVIRHYVSCLLCSF